MKKTLCIILIAFLIFQGFNVRAVSAKSAVVINYETGEILYSLNSKEKLPMASTTKIMTALLLCESGNLEKEITATKEMVSVEGSSMGLRAGDRINLEGLLYGMLLCSGNDAANAAAIAVGGNKDNFVKLMNNRAEQLNLHSTHFETASGLDGETHYTTAEDLAELTRFALHNSIFAEAVKTKTKEIYFTDPPKKITVSNHNKLLTLYDGAIGVKTGFTKKSGRCLVSAAKKDGKTVIAVTLNDPNDWEDHKLLLDSGFSKLNEYKIEEEKYCVKTAYGNIKELQFSSGQKIVHFKNYENLNLTKQIPQFVYFPIKKNEKIGKIVLYKDGISIYKKDIVSDKQYNVPDIKVSEKIKNLFLYIISFIN